jgi:hypothetical protein
MNINRVEFSGSAKENTGYIVNKDIDSESSGQLNVPFDNNNRHYKMVQEWIAEGGVVTPWVDPTTSYQHWYNDISKLDRDMPRSLEDMLDGMPDKSGVAQITLDRLQTKKDLRATKP